MDRRLIEIARETEPAFAKILPSRDVESHGVVEVQGEVVATLQDRIKAIELDLVRERRLARVRRTSRRNDRATSRNVMLCLAKKGGSSFVSCQRGAKTLCRL